MGKFIELDLAGHNEARKQRIHEAFLEELNELKEFYYNQREKIEGLGMPENEANNKLYDSKQDEMRELEFALQRRRKKLKESGIEEWLTEDSIREEYKKRPLIILNTPEYPRAMAEADLVLVDRDLQKLQMERDELVKRGMEEMEPGPFMVEIDKVDKRIEAVNREKRDILDRKAESDRKAQNPNSQTRKKGVK